MLLAMVNIAQSDAERVTESSRASERSVDPGHPPPSSHRTSKRGQNQTVGCRPDEASGVRPTYSELSELNSRNVHFMTIRRRGSAILKRLEQILKCDWKPATIDIPKRRHKRIQYLDETIQLDDYEGTLRQIAVTGFGREKTTLFLTNHLDASPREMIMNYARRNGIEDGLGTGASFTVGTILAETD